MPTKDLRNHFLAHRSVIDAATGLTTSDKSENVLRALEAAKKRGATAIAIGGGAGLKRSDADQVPAVPSDVSLPV